MRHAFPHTLVFVAGSAVLAGLVALTAANAAQVSGPQKSQDGNEWSYDVSAGPSEVISDFHLALACGQPGESAQAVAARVPTTIQPRRGPTGWGFIRSQAIRQSDGRFCIFVSWRAETQGSALRNGASGRFTIQGPGRPNQELAGGPGQWFLSATVVPTRQNPLRGGFVHPGQRGYVPANVQGGPQGQASEVPQRVVVKARTQDAPTAYHRRCAAQLAENTRLELASEGTTLQLPESDYVAFMKEDIGVYLTSQEPIVGDLKLCAQELDRYLARAAKKHVDELGQIYGLQMLKR